jgi:hypothetical protein
VWEGGRFDTRVRWGLVVQPEKTMRRVCPVCDRDRHNRCHLHCQNGYHLHAW